MGYHYVSIYIYDLRNPGSDISIFLSLRFIELLLRFIELVFRHIELIIPIYRNIIAFYRINRIII